MSGYVTSYRNPDALKGVHVMYSRFPEQGRPPEDIDLTGSFLMPGQIESYRSVNRPGRKDIDLTNDQILRSAQDEGRPSVNSHDSGHTFFRKQESLSLSHPMVHLRGSGEYENGLPGTRWFTGPLFHAGVTSNSLFDRVPDINVGYYGMQAIQRTRPAKPVANYAQFIGELNRLPKLLVSKATFSNKAARYRDLNPGNAYLAVEFGWKPFIRDVLKIVKAVKNSQKIIDQYERDSGRVVRRSAGFDPVVTNTEIRRDSEFSFGFLDSNGFRDFMHNRSWKGVQTVTKTSSERYWFSGAYTYYLEHGRDAVSKMKRYEELANQVLGTRLTPETLWQLAPWSWLIDWFVDISAITGNAVAFSNDGLVLKYGYLMRQTTQRIVCRSENVKFWSPGYDGDVTSIRTLVQQERVRATPYGFGVNMDGLNDYQWSILGALGLSRGGTKKMRYNE